MLGSTSKPTEAKIRTKEIDKRLRGKRALAEKQWWTPSFTIKTAVLTASKIHFFSLKKFKVCLKSSKKRKIPIKRIKNFNMKINGNPPVSFELSFCKKDL